MLLETSRLWDTAGDCAQIILCLVILFFFLRNRRINKRTASKAKTRPESISFNEQIFAQTAQQQIEQAFANIRAGLAIEQKNLMTVLRIKQMNPKAGELYRLGTINQMIPDPGPRQSSAQDADGENQQETIRKYSAKGLSTKKISEKLKVPLSEVELILSLQEK